MTTGGGRIRCLNGCNAEKTTTCTWHIVPLLAVARGVTLKSLLNTASIDAKIAISIFVLSVPKNRPRSRQADKKYVSDASEVSPGNDIEVTLKT